MLLGDSLKAIVFEKQAKRISINYCQAESIANIIGDT